MYGYGSYGNYNNYESYYDPDKYIKLFGFSLGWGKQLRWPDDYFQLSLSLSYTRYMLKNWSYFLMTNGNSNNLNLSIQLSRTSTDNQALPTPWFRVRGIGYRYSAMVGMGRQGLRTPRHQL